MGRVRLIATLLLAALVASLVPSTPANAVADYAEFKNTWNCDGADSARCGLIKGGFKGKLPCEKAWQVEIADCAGQILALQNRIVVTSGEFNRGLILGYDTKTGKEAWRVPAPDTRNALLVADKDLYVLASGGATTLVRVHSADDGKQKSEFTVRDAETLSVFDGQLWGAGQGVWAASAKDGKNPLDVKIGGGRFENSVIVQNGKSALVRCGAQLHSVSKSKDKPEWSIDLLAKSEISGVAHLATNGNYAVVCLAQAVEVVDLKKKKSVFKLESAQYFRPRVALDDTRLYVVGRSCLNIYELSTGKLLVTQSGDGALCGGPIVVDDAVIVSSTEKTFFYSRAKGELLGEIPFGGQPVLAQGALYLLSFLPQYKNRATCTLIRMDFAVPAAPEKRTARQPTPVKSPVFAGDAAFVGCKESMGEHEFEPGWELAPTLTSPAVAGDGRVFTCQYVDMQKKDGNHALLALDAATGDELWRETFPRRPEFNNLCVAPSAPLYRKGKVYVHTQEWRDRDLYRCYDAANGQMLWSVPVDVGGGVLTFAELGYFIHKDRNSMRYCVDLETGRDIGELGREEFMGHEMRTIDGCVIGASNGVVRRFDPKTLKETWSRRIDVTSELSPVMVREGKVFLIGDNAWAWMDVATGKVLGSGNAKREIFGNYAYYDGEIYAMKMNGTLVALEATTLKILREYPGIKLIRAPALPTEDLLIVCDATSTHVFERKTGKELQLLKGAGWLSLGAGCLFVQGAAYEPNRSQGAPALTVYRVAKKRANKPPAANDMALKLSKLVTTELKLDATDADGDALQAWITPTKETYLYCVFQRKSDGKPGDVIRPGEFTQVEDGQLRLIAQFSHLRTPPPKGFALEYKYYVSDGRAKSAEASLTVTFAPESVQPKETARQQAIVHAIAGMTLSGRIDLPAHETLLTTGSATKGRGSLSRDGRWAYTPTEGASGLDQGMTFLLKSAQGDVELRLQVYITGKNDLGPLVVTNAPLSASLAKDFEYAPSVGPEWSKGGGVEFSLLEEPQGMSIRPDANGRAIITWKPAGKAGDSVAFKVLVVDTTRHLASVQFVTMTLCP